MKLIFTITLCAIFGQNLGFGLFRKDDFQICQDAKPVEGVKIADLPEKVYVKYMATNSNSLNNVYANMDGLKIDFLGLYNISYTGVDKQQHIFKGLSTINIEDQGVSYKIVAYEPDQYLLVYGCIQIGDTKLVERNLMTTTLDNDLDAPLAFDRGMGFSTDLIELPFNFLDLIDG
uniref:Uncharacterized protein n=1 Tax=Clastoptera arizonana TaxID=38151 RepID=A0A1B6EFN7_9HEMI